MSTWTVPVSSTPPSTPGSHQLRTDSLASNPSTTPAGPPPFELSFTPAGAPNFSANGSSQVTSQNAASKSKPDFAINMGSRRNISSPSFKTHHQSKFAGYRHSGQSPTFRVSRTTNNRVLKNSLFGSSPPSKLLGVHTTRLNDDEGDEDELEEEDYNDELEDDNMISESGSEDEPALPTVTEYSRLPSALISDGNPSYHVRPSSENGTPRGIKRSRGGAAISPRSPSRGACREDSAISSIAKGIASQLGAAPLSDPDKLILETDVLLRELYPQDNISDVSEKVLEVALQAVTEKLCTLWHSCRNQLSSQTAMEGDYTIGIGPGSNAPTALKAIFLATLILQLHHPPAAKGKQALALTRANRSSRPNPFYNDSHGPVKPTAVSKVLIDWLDDSHSPYEIALINLSSHQPNPTAHYNFWDLLFSMTLRGQIQQVITLLKKSDFKVAHTAREDGHAQDGYSGMQLKNTEKAIARTVQLLENCPAVQDGDWDMAGNEWCMFRKRVEQTLNNLTILAEGRDRDMDPTDSGFEASNFGIKSPTMKLSQSARQAESHVPWTIYQNLKTMYGVLLGGTTEVVSSAQDWVEATVGLTIWWDGESDEEMAIGSLAMTRRSLTRSQPRGTRLVDLNPSAAYLRRLAFSFQLATEDSGEDLFKINPLNPVEVGLASIFEGNIEEVIGILRGWSLPVASAVIEIGSLGGWYESLPGPAIDGFNDSDLMVLSSYGQPSQGINRDSILIDYAEALLEKPIVQAFLQEAKEGWELSLSVLTRLDDTNMANKHLRDFLSRISLRSDERVDKILDICRNFGLDKDAQAIAEKYADSIAEDSDKYGTALIYYARAHCTKKVKDVLDLLISLSLVQSIGFPPISSLDHDLSQLVFSPKESLEQIAENDGEAAELLHKYLTGYATLRKFYDLRDEEVNLKDGQKPSLRPIARKKAAAAALLAVINSAADNIHGGLYDEQRGSIVQVDGLLALLGEALLFLNQPSRILTLPQYFSLLKAIEDLQTVTPRVYTQCEECFRSTLAAHSSSSSHQAPRSRSLLKQTVSSMTSSSGFSLIGSSMLGDSAISAEGDGGRTESGSGGSFWMVKMAGGNDGDGDGVKRGWDWRKGWAKESSGEDLLRVLRLALAKEISTAWIEGVRY